MEYCYYYSNSHLNFQIYSVYNIIYYTRILNEKRLEVSFSSNCILNSYIFVAWLRTYLVRTMSYTYFTLNILAKYINYILYYYIIYFL